jgi:hypothetical protein
MVEVIVFVKVTGLGHLDDLGGGGAEYLPRSTRDAEAREIVRRRVKKVRCMLFVLKLFEVLRVY